MSETNAGSRPLKILCIHGYRQNAQMFREKSGSLRKMLKKYAEFDFVTAPHRVPPGNQGSAAWGLQQEQQQNGEESLPEAEPGTSATQGDSDDPGERGWWFSREDDYFKSVDYSDISKGFDASAEMIVAKLEENSYDGILGFSQGASMVSMLCLMQQQRGKQWFKFAVLIAGFKSRSTAHDVHYSGRSEIPSLHVYGETDQIISESMSEELLQYFRDPTILRHPGGHFVPAASAQKKGYMGFLNDMKVLCI
ncbi:esterase OVCA2 [Aplysia californica]|uniref:Esterase OVCA2 n=1 Tax=Aplysia californica TaxID=6500 RepID=A0ABM0JLC6_APLCA|nr:esterase OVCA2 [Aplysia californica]